ncbi:MAG: hypothetical protein U0939_01525 [Pirellulales bacterium]
MDTGNENRIADHHFSPETEPADAASQSFVGRWNQLVSTTNWEKGRIIHEWREALMAAEAPVSEYSDEAWTQLVQGVTPQHVGRLRRVYSRFGALREQFPGLYWSHFHAAIDWNDAEMWLEGAVHSEWSVSQMRRQRWETLGAVEQDRPHDSQIVSADVDEDVIATDAAIAEAEVPEAVRERLTEMPTGPLAEGPDFGEEPEMESSYDGGLEGGLTGDVGAESTTAAPAAPAVRPFEHLPALPDDLTDAFERLKLAILHHKTDGWRDIACADLCAALEALKTLALAP